MHITLPDSRGTLETYALRGEVLPVTVPEVPFNRVAFAAAHVVADPFGNADPSGPPAIDWGATLAYRNGASPASLRSRLGVTPASAASRSGSGEQPS